MPVLLLKMLTINSCEATLAEQGSIEKEKTQGHSGPMVNQI